MYAQVWPLLFEHFDPWEYNPHTFIQLSWISRSARSFFLSDRVWKHVNPYQLESGIASDFIAKTSSDKKLRQESRLAWHFAHRLYDFKAGDLLLDEWTVGNLSGLDRDIDCLYYKLGWLVATSVIFFRKDLRKLAIDDEGLMLAAVQIMPATIRRCSKRLQTNERIALAAAKTKRNTIFIDTASKDPSYVHYFPAFTEASGSVVELMPQQWATHWDICIECLAQDLRAMTIMDEHWPDWYMSLDFVLEAARRNPNIFTTHVVTDEEPQEVFFEEDPALYTLMTNFSKQFITSAKVRDRAAIVRMFTDPRDEYLFHYLTPTGCKAVNYPAEILDCIFDEHPDFRHDRDMLEMLIKWYGGSLEYADSSIKDKELVMMACRRYGPALEFADVLQFDKDVVTEATDTDMSALKFAGTSLRDNYDFARGRLERDGSAYKHISERLKKDRTLFALAIKTWPKAYEVCPKKFRSDKELAREAVWAEPGVIKFTDFMHDREFVLYALKHRAILLLDICQHLHEDYEVVLTACENNGLNLQYIDSDLRTNRDICKAAVHDTIVAMAMCPPELTQDITILEDLGSRLGWIIPEKGVVKI